MKIELVWPIFTLVNRNRGGNCARTVVTQSLTVLGFILITRLGNIVTMSWIASFLRSSYPSNNVVGRLQEFASCELYRDFFDGYVTGCFERPIGTTQDVHPHSQHNFGQCFIWMWNSIVAMLLFKLLK